MDIKGRTLGKGKPLICVPVMDHRKEDIVAEAQRLVEAGAQMIEWRVDAFENVHSLDAVREVLQELKTIVKDTILVFTFRSQKQGGLLELEDEKVYDLHRIAAESEAVDFVDVEYFRMENPCGVIQSLQHMGTRVIASHHNFHETPSEEVVGMLLEEMARGGADIVKLAVMPQNTEDVLRLLEETNAFHKKHPDQLLITMSMGKLGVISRISGETFGSCVTFGAGKNASAPGQIPMQKLQEILDAVSG